MAQQLSLDWRKPEHRSSLPNAAVEVTPSPERIACDDSFISSPEAACDVSPSPAGATQPFIASDEDLGEYFFSKAEAK